MTEILDGATQNTYLPTQLQQYIHLSRYARWLDKENRRETWPETVNRYVNFFEEKFPGVFPSDEIRESILTLKTMPSMRALMTAGTALERDNVAGFNPVSGDTRVVTREFGNIAISKLSGKTATVLNKNGVWTQATFRSYGVQPLHKVTMRRNSNSVVSVKCTANHRWVLESGEVVPTTNLVVGPRDASKIPMATASKPEIDADYYLGIKHGIVYGDGSAAKTAERVNGYHLRLCGDSKELLSFFEGYPVSYAPSANGDPIIMMYDGFAATHSLKTLPENETESYVLGFIRGWLAADGSVTANSQVTLCCEETGVNWLKQNGERLGFVVQKVLVQSPETNYGTRTRDSFIVHLQRHGLVPEDFLCSWKRANFQPLISHFVVSEVEPTGEEAEVFCAEVPDTNTFVLEGGIVTGNCSYLAIDHPRAFDEALMILMCGTGLGFSVERQSIVKLPEVPEELHPTDTVIAVRDSKIGWATAYKELITLLYAGQIPKWDTSKVRPAGARLKTFGGRASGPVPLEDLFRFTINMFRQAAGRKLSSIECHDIICKVADIVVVGGVRRSALISLSNLSDDRMRDAKVGQFWDTEPQRNLANNSAVYTEKPSAEIFLKEWMALIKSRSGERGIFNREAAKKKALESGRRDATYEFGLNPCAEITLRSCGFCNLSEVVIRAEDTLETLLEKVRIATIVGTFQSTLTRFRYLRPIWQKNAEEERLLGVSLTGIMDHTVLSKVSEEAVTWLTAMKQMALDTNAEWAAKLGITMSVAITTGKPSGTVSQLVDSSSGCHARYSKYYYRTVRADKKDPLALMMRAAGFPVEDCVSKPDSVDIFYFPVKGPDAGVYRNDMTAIDQLNHYLMLKNVWCEHNQSITVYVRDAEWIKVGAWVYDNFDAISGVSFLPHTDHVYRQAPFIEVDEAQYDDLLAKMPDVNWDRLHEFEKVDGTTSARDFACVSGVCELI